MNFIYRSMRTKRARRWYGVFGLTLWITACALAFAHNAGWIGPVWSHVFAIAAGVWMVSVFAYLFRDHWENRP